MGSVTAQLQLLQQLEGQLLRFRKEKSFVDPALKDARKQFRATAEVILLQNYRVALVRMSPNKVCNLQQDLGKLLEMRLGHHFLTTFNA